jgi:hypothetical protein
MMTTAHHNHRKRSIMSEPIHPVPSQPKPQPAQECESLHAASVEYALDGFRMNAIQLLSLNVPLSAVLNTLSNAVASQEMYDEDRQVPKQKSRARWEELCEDLSQIAQSHLIHAAKTLKKNCQFSNSTIVELVERNLLTQTDWDQAHGKAGKTKAGGQHDDHDPQDASETVVKRVIANCDGGESLRKGVAATLAAFTDVPRPIVAKRVIVNCDGGESLKKAMEGTLAMFRDGSVKG